MKKIGLIILAAAFALSAGAQSGNNCQCCTEIGLQFNFLVGDWEVLDTAGRVISTSSVDAMHDNCVIQENWKSAGFGFTGTSYNFYDAGAGEWVQVWVDNNGGNLLLRGGIKEGSMVLESEATPRPQGGSSYNRITWTPNDDGTVRQLWETSTDYGASWSVLFDGLYKKKTSEK